MKTVVLPILMTLFVLSFVSAQTALDFDPEVGDQQVKIPAITCPQEFTFEAWIHFRGSEYTYTTILEFGDDAPYFGIRLGKLTLYPEIESPEDVPLNQWVHVAGSYSSFNGEAKLYVNGGLVAEETDIDFDLSGIGAGIAYNDSDHVFNGAIDELRIWNFVRSQEDILEQMTICSNGNEPGLYACYHFDEGTGLVAHDATSNNFDGDLLNMDSINDWINHESCLASSIVDAEIQPNPVHVFPNPVSEFIQLEGLTAPTNYSIFNTIGVELQSGVRSASDPIDVQQLPVGAYFIRLGTGQTLRFYKN